MMLVTERPLLLTRTCSRVCLLSQRLVSVLLSIQSLMNASPLKNEPGFEGVTDVVRGFKEPVLVTHASRRTAQ